MSRYALPLDGYDHASVWGYDGQSASYFAQLWRNSSDSDEEPDVSLNWFTGRREIESPQNLAELIRNRTGMGIGEVLRSMAAARTAPESATLLEMAALLATSEL